MNHLSQRRRQLVNVQERVAHIEELLRNICLLKTKTAITNPKLTISASKKHSESLSKVSSHRGPLANHSCLQFSNHCNMYTVTGSMNIYLKARGSFFRSILIILGRPLAISPGRPWQLRGSFRFPPNLCRTARPRFTDIPSLWRKLYHRQ